MFTAARILRERNDFTRDDGTPLSYTLVNIRDWCKNDFEVVHQLRINTDYSNHRYDVILLINGVPVAQVELKTLGINPRRAMEQIIDYKSDAGNGYTRTLLCFIQLFIVSNRTQTFYFANNNARHFAFNADEQFLPVYRFTGIWLMRTGEIEANLVTLNESFRLPYIPELVARKTGGPEQSTLNDADIAFHEAEYLRLRSELQAAHEASRLIEAPTNETRAALNELLVRVRLN